MSYTYQRTYQGPLKLAIFDWAGTMIDYGCCAPAAAFIEGYRRKEIKITMAQAREPMGMGKWDHIKVIGEMASVVAQWERFYGRSLTDADVDDMYADFVPVLMDVLVDYTTLIPSAAETAVFLRQNNILVAGTTGYFEEAMQVCVDAAAKQGYSPDLSMCATQVSGGRPAPWLIYNVMEKLNVQPREAVVKIGDTVPDIEAGLNAGVWTIGVAQTGNEVGLTQAEIAQLDQADLAKRVAKARQKLLQSGAHYVVDGVWDVPLVVEQINGRLARGERP
ncbi:MAG: phosphonoacetaldehyde hydrolase [Chloroflexota bacterium]